ncbi:MAG: YebC/PmpR family DNA-binding transcriptional regulator [Bdellovibrionales bacterium]|nr:YebC/PmpR family DNA-binding transcriptional regulator [Bdellovibrionales bacterium]
MAGHSKWSKIKRKKGANDAKRGKIFTKLIREITIAARMGGGDLESNARLKTAVMTAKSANMPNDNIDRAIKKGAGGGEADQLEEVTYEGYGPAGAALIIDVLTDNKMRTLPEVRHILNKYNGNLGENGSVSWNFETKGYFTVSKKTIQEETLMNLAIEAGADDFSSEDESVFEIYSSVANFHMVQNALEKHNIATESAQISKLPKTMVSIDGKDAQNMLKIMELLDDNDDIQNVWTNADLPDEMMDS